jgi:hypothetical protein
MAEKGRPTKYLEEYNNKVDEYLELHQDKELERVGLRSENGYEKIDYVLRVNLPTIEGFARFIGVNKTTLYEWDKKYPDFSNSLDKIRIEQQTRLINEGLAGNYNPTIAKLILSSNHGMREKTEQDITTGGKEINAINYIVPNGNNDTTNEETARSISSSE